MRRVSNCVTLGFFIILILSPSLHAQTLSNASSDPNAAAANPAPVGQAPDDATKKITELVHAGKYAEAQQLTTGLLVAYPDDQRLIKAKALIDKLLLHDDSSRAASANNRPVQPEARANAEQLTGMDKVDYNALILLARRAQQITDISEQKKLLQQFMDESSTFLQKHPDQMLLWQLRAATAISEDDLLAGYEAGQKLFAGGADSNDATVQNLLAQLKNKGWLDKERANNQAVLLDIYGSMQGTWRESFSQVSPGGGAQCFSCGRRKNSVVENEYKEEFDVSKSAPVIQAHIIDNSGKTDVVPTKFTVVGSGKLLCVLYIDEEHAYKEATSCEIGKTKTTMTLIVLRNGQPETHLFTQTDNKR